MRGFVYSLMTDKITAAYAQPFKLVLYLLSLVYAGAIIIRKAFYKAGIFKSHKVPLCVISVGNLTLGGTGKTPFVIEIAKLLKNELKQDPAILIRGYGWDEQTMLRRNLPDIPILVGENRVRSSYRAVKLYGTSVAILDDGFQHWEMNRDIDIVLVDSRNPFGNSCLFPRGILREPKDALSRAGIVVLTKTNKPFCDLAKLRKEILNINGGVMFLEAMHEPKSFYYAKQNRTLDLSYAKGKRVILLSSIGDPLYFEDTVKDLGASIITHIVFPDHHDYKKKDIEKIKKICSERSFELIITTEKDAVKLNRLGFFFKDYQVITLVIEMEITEGKEDLVDRLRSLYTS